jgi:hypothetical protein
MKKVLVASILGLALSAASSYGQGFIVMQNYDAVSTTTPTTILYSGVTFGSSSPAGLVGKYVGEQSGIKVDLLFSLTGAAGTYSVAANSQTAFFGTSANGGTPVSDGAGSFFGSTLSIPGYTSGNAFFQVEAYDGTSYATALNYKGLSAVFSMPLQTNNGLPAPDLLNLGGAQGTTIQGLAPFVVNPVPEPSILALSGIGAAALMLIRRKK